MGPPSQRRFLQRLYGAALSGVDPEDAVARALASGEVRRALSGRRRIGIFAVGKAASAMARGARARLLPRGPALVVLPRGGSPAGLPGATVLFAAHPRPDAASVRAARRALRFFEGFGSEDAIVCLISGGASSLLALPRPGVTLAQKRRAVEALSRSGAPIQALNRLRTSLSAVKGGRLGRRTAARLVTLVLSDIPGDRAELVGSGPTVRRRAGDVVRVIGSNAGGIRAAAKEARRLGWRVALAPAALSGEARSAGRRLARVTRGLRAGTVLLAGGETVVVLGSARVSRGGRSLELALSLALELDGDPDAVGLAAGSDGRDGSSTAAGAFADGTTIGRARRLGLDAGSALRLHGTHSFFARLGDLWVTGPTGTNVGDWVFLLRGNPGGD
jgi:glycerate 2-kinase